MLDGIIVLFHSVSSILNIMGLVYGLALLVQYFVKILAII